VIDKIQNRVVIFLVHFILSQQAGDLQVGHVLNILELQYIPLHLLFINAVNEQPVLLQLDKLL
jgi:hypothetical protein